MSCLGAVTCIKTTFSFLPRYTFYCILWQPDNNQTLLKYRQNISFIIASSVHSTDLKPTTTTTSTTSGFNEIRISEKFVDRFCEVGIEGARCVAKRCRMQSSARTAVVDIFFNYSVVCRIILTYKSLPMIAKSQQRKKIAIYKNTTARWANNHLIWNRQFFSHQEKHFFSRVWSMKVKAESVSYWRNTCLWRIHNWKLFRFFPLQIHLLKIIVAINQMK